MNKLKSKKKFIIIITILLFIIVVISFGSQRFFFYDISKDINIFTDKIAHRGLVDDKLPENSLAAFSCAIDAGYSIEFDVRITKDNELVVFHDENLQRMTGVDKDIADLTLEEIRYNYLIDTSEKIPTLSEVLDFVDGRVALLIEVKNAGIPGRLEEELIKLLSSYNGKFSVQSKNPLVGLWFDKNAENIAFGQLSDNTAISSKFIMNMKDNLLCLISTPNYIVYNYENLMDDDFNNERKLGLTVITWTLPLDQESSEYADYLIVSALK